MATQTDSNSEPTFKNGYKAGPFASVTCLHGGVTREPVHEKAAKKGEDDVGYVGDRAPEKMLLTNHNPLVSYMGDSPSGAPGTDSYASLG
jgi:hypothetical protein